MNQQVVIRFALGIVFGAVGYYLSTIFLNPQEEGVRTGARVISIVLAGGAGIFLKT